MPLACVVAVSCSGYSDGTSDRAAVVTSAPAAPRSQPEVAMAPPEPAPHESDDMFDERPSELPAPTPVQPGASRVLLVAQSERFDGYLTDGAGRALYMFAGDVTGLPESACLGECARTWPPFDVPGFAAIQHAVAAEIARFHRQDGAWQMTYRGQPLYYRAREAGTHAVTGDGTDSRWFVARDYLLFLAAAHGFAPAGGAAVGGTFLTDGSGRTLYVCLDDRPRTPSAAAISSCDAACIVSHPIFPTSETQRTTLLPSALAPQDLGELVRPDGQLQLTYRGWPLYYYARDDMAGSVAAHNDRAWRTIDPLSFATALKPENDESE